MKKTCLRLLPLLLMVAFVAGCSNTGSVQSDAVEAGTDSVALDAPAQSAADKTGTNGNSLGLDLTTLESGLASDIAHRISNFPTEYLGSTIKLRGHYEVAENYNTGGYIHGIVACNQILCCEAVIEFIWSGEHSYPEDYPKEFSQIELEGVLKSYEEAGETYYYLAVDDISRQYNSVINNYS